MERYPWVEVLLFEVLRVIVFYPTRQDAYRVVVLTTMVYVAAQIYPTPEFTDPLKATFPNHWRRVRDEVHTKADTSGLDDLPSNFPLTKKLW
ncbi:hypothetical protein BDM02DRAFT_3122622 [Thelephora ganbajun]|uniref:Uncharacterized protein n=1 Tax=Thelephora ganbajun TaxID=370292 RepID=A0ACB6Z2U1_THEGA|nr:hypothetical protein BDM02DRAFT_3122622 [Thelephora ganbajun]